MSLAIYQIMVAADSTLSRDYSVNVVHFNYTAVAGGVDWDGDALDIATQYRDHVMNGSASREIRVKAYDQEQPQPRDLKGQAVLNAGAAAPAGMPREVAVCLSFYAGTNHPRNRGRIYIPAFALPEAVGGRPSSISRSRLLDFATALGAIGGPGVEWSVYSKADNQHKAVTSAWVDDEWDTVRSRGLKSTTRDTRAITA